MNIWKVSKYAITWVQEIKNSKKAPRPIDEYWSGREIEEGVWTRNLLVVL
jgi:hypothetical protein